MARLLAEENFENKVLEQLSSLNWDINYSFQRERYDQAIDYELLKKQIYQINQEKEITSQLIEEVIVEIKRISGNANEQNILGTRYLLKGVKVYDEFKKRSLTIKIISDDLDKNHYGAINQFELINSNGNKRFPDIVCFINGLPIIVCELKAADAMETIEDAYKQNASLKRQFPNLYSFNIFDFLASDDISCKYGSITAPFEKYFNANLCKTNENKSIQRLFNHEIIHDFINFFSFYSDDKSIKYVAGLHQIEAVQATIKKFKNKETHDHKGGVVWHTQGSGKSITMLMLSKLIIKYFPLSTILLVTDRNSLDQQLFNVFQKNSKYLSCIPEPVETRSDLIEKLKNKKHFGIYFTTVQKFAIDTGLLSKRDDIYVLVDEAHRSQNNIEGEKKLNEKLKEFIIKFGYAKFMRDAFPNATITGFTGTPLMGNKKTTGIFGNYNHKYSMSESIRDGSTVPIYYEARKPNIFLNKEGTKLMDEIQDCYAKTLDPNDIDAEEKMNSLYKVVKEKMILENPDVIFSKANDMLRHLKIRAKLLNGKAMVVVASRKAAFLYYKSFLKIDPTLKDKLILVITHSNKDSVEEEQMIVPKFELSSVASKFKKSESNYKIVIVVDMWLTGFDVPDLDVMYIDKLMRWHNLMQAIARVNRTFKNKESGLVVDYLGIWKHLSDALLQYANANEIEIDMDLKDIERAKIKLLDELDIIEEHFIPNIKTFPDLNSKEQYNFVLQSVNHVLKYNFDKGNEFKCKVKRITKLMKFVFTVIDKNIASMVKVITIIKQFATRKNLAFDDQLNISIKKLKLAIEQAVDINSSQAILQPVKINKDISVVAALLETEARQLRNTQPNVAKKLLEDSINSNLALMKKTRPHFARKVSDMLKDILKRFQHEEDLQKYLDVLFDLSKEITTTLREDPAFSDPHLQAFFEILGDDEYFKQNKNSELLRKIAEDLMSVVKINITDQFYKNSKVRNKIAIQLKKILKNKYNYPPKKLNGISKILVDRINQEIKYSSEYYINKKEVI